jgi:hypothetical protein
VVGEDAYQEFTAGAIPVRRVVAGGVGWLVIVEHERGFLPAFDQHLEAVRRGEAPIENVGYVVTWSGMTGDGFRATVIRLELRVDGLRARTRLVFKGEALSPLWRLTEGAMLGLVLDPTAHGAASSLTGIWVIGPTPVPDGLRRVLTQAGVPRPARVPRPPSARRQRRRQRRSVRFAKHRRGRQRVQGPDSGKRNGDDHA